MLSFHAAKARGSCARLALPLLSVASIVLVGHPAAALATRAQDSASHPDGSGLRIGDVVNTLGWDSLKRGEVGELDFARDRLVFVKGDTRSAIPVAAVKSFSLENTTRPLLRGMKGTAASFAPQGAGQLYSAIRLGAETLTLLYADRNQGLHAAVVVLPKGRKNDALQALASEGFEPSSNLPGNAPSSGPPPVATAYPPEFGKRSSLRVLFPACTAPGAPAAFLAGIYEDLIAQIAKSGVYAEVWRQGDVNASPDALTLAVTVTRVKKGSAAARGALPVLGMFVGETLIDADLNLADASGATLWNHKLEGSKRLPGESTVATKSLAAHVSKALRAFRPTAGQGPA